MPFLRVATGIYSHLSVYFTKVKAQLSFVFTDPSHFKHQRLLTYCFIAEYIQTELSGETAAGQQYFYGFQCSIHIFFWYHLSKHIEVLTRVSPKQHHPSWKGRCQGLQRGKGRVFKAREQTMPHWKVVTFLSLSCLRDSRFHFGCFLIETLYITQS